MAKGLYIDASQLGKRAKQFEELLIRFPKGIDDVLNTNILEAATEAKQLAPGDRGPLRQGISGITTKPLVKTLTSQAPYSAYVEFGTGTYAAAYVGTLKPEFATYAAGFKGKSGRGDYFDFLNAILDWVKRHHLAQITNSYTGRKHTKKEDLLLVAETIAWSILKKGIHPHPFLIPAFNKMIAKLKKDLIRFLNYVKL